MPPLRLLTSNPRYLEYHGRPLLVISSAEHYGSLLNLDFDYVKHLDTLASYGFNQARVFSGTYREIPGSFGITVNTLAPAEGRFLCPWKRSAEPGYACGGNKFDLSEWDDAYFARLRHLVATAAKRRVMLEIVLFCYLYGDELWAASPMNAANNVNGVGDVPAGKVYTMANRRLLAAQEAVVRRIASELRGADNVYYEIINEPYSTSEGVSFEPWQAHIARVIRSAERTSSQRHLIAQNIANGSRMVFDPDPSVSILNFHYATPEAVHCNYHLGRVIADDETGFAGSEIAPYRREAWSFMLSGGGIFSHLDYSFTVEKPDGTHEVDTKTPGIGGHYLRKQYKVLKDFLESFQFWNLRPANHLQPGHAHRHLAHILADPGRAYAAYFDKPLTQDHFGLFLVPGTYRAEWISPSDGATLTVELFAHKGGERRLVPPPYEEDIALKVVRAKRAQP